MENGTQLHDLKAGFHIQEVNFIILNLINMSSSHDGYTAHVYMFHQIMHVAS